MRAKSDVAVQAAELESNFGERQVVSIDNFGAPEASECLGKDDAKGLLGLVSLSIAINLATCDKAPLLTILAGTEADASIKLVLIRRE